MPRLSKLISGKTMPLLSIENLNAGYGPLAVLHNVSLSVNQGEIVAVLGANGAGKSTLLRVISRLIPFQSGSLSFKDKTIAKKSASQVARLGISHVPEGRGIFGNLTVIENLTLATFANTGLKSTSKVFGDIFDMFPVLGQRKKQLAATLSGGEQQMLAIGRAIVANGDLFILDEPSMGLSPLFVNTVFSIISQINKQGKTVLVVEQNASMALAISQRAYVMENGNIVATGTGKEIAQNAELKKAYLG